MGKLLVTRVSDLKTEKARTDKKVSRQHYTLYVVDSSNPFTAGGQREMFQNHTQDGKSAFWKTIDYNFAKAMSGKEVEGEIVRLNVEPYDINGRPANSYTCVVLKGEDASIIAGKAGHKVIGAIAQASEKEAASL